MAIIRTSEKTEISFWQFFRLTFVLFSFYLLGDAFYRWDGFKYYASFAEFLPAVALASILWSLIAVLTAIFIWLLLKSTEWFFQRAGLKIRFEHLILYTGIFILLGALIWKVKKLAWPEERTTLQLKLIVFIGAALITGFLTRLFRNKAERWVNVVQERITPLEWLFGIFVILSVPLVVHNTWIKKPYNAISQEFAQSSVTDENRPNIILITFDALTARDMSLYGYYRETTPFISEWAKTALLFIRAEAASNFTISATASLMTGKRVWTHQTYQIEGSIPLKSRSESLPAVLKKSGYFNMAFVVNPHASVKKLGISNSFDFAPIASEFSYPRSLFGWKFGVVDTTLYRLFGDKIKLHDWILQRDFILYRFVSVISRDFDETEVPIEKAFHRFLEVIENNSPEPYFAWIHVFPPHEPYLPPNHLKGFFSSSQDMRTFKKQEKIKLETYKYLFKHQPFPEKMQPTINLLRVYYDEFIRYCDREFEDFINQLIKRNKLKNTIIILSSDHGESFEHGYFTHGGPFLYEQVTNIPLIIREPDQREGQIINDLVESIDIPPTILDLANIPIPSWMEGRSLVPLARGKKLPQRPAFSMNFEENPSVDNQIIRGSIAVREGDYKLIYYLEKKESLLFNLKLDPDEMENLFDKEKERSKLLLGLIQDNLKKANKRF